MKWDLKTITKYINIGMDEIDNPGEVWLKKVFPKSHKNKFLPEDMIYAYNAGLIEGKKPPGYHDVDDFYKE